MAPMARQFMLSTPEWKTVNSYGGPTAFLASYGLKPYEYHDVAQGEQIARQMAAQDQAAKSKQGSTAGGGTNHV